MVKRIMDTKTTFSMVTGELHESLHWMREAFDTNNQDRLAGEIGYAVKLLHQATLLADLDPLIIFKKFTTDELGAMVSSGDGATACELPTSLGSMGGQE
mgnify:CR=1 FL=1